MAIYLASSLAARNGGTWPVAEDIAVKGGFRVVANSAERDAIDSLSRKAGMLVLTQSDNKIWLLNSDLTTWGSLTQTINNSTTTTAGLMSSADKSILDNLSLNALTALTANAPLVSSGGKTPTLSIPAATSSQNGYLSAQDWVTFNAKGTGNGTVLSVRGTAPLASTGGTDPVISMPAASATQSGYLTSTDWNTFNNKASASGSVAQVTATAPCVSSGGTNPVISMPASTSSVDGYLRATDWVTFNSKGNGTVQSVNASTPLTSTGGVNPTISMAAASSTQNGYLRATDWVTFNSKGNGNVNTVSAQSPLVNAGTATDPVISMPAATTTSHGYMTNSDKAKLDGISAGATNYVHPTGDGNLHVPATGTGNAGKVLTAGSTAGSMTWSTPTGGVTSVNGQTGSVTIDNTSITGLKTTDNAQFASLGVGTTSSGVAGEIRSTGNITAFYSSDRTLKENVKPIIGALTKVLQVNGVEFDWTDAYLAAHGGEDSYFNRKHDVGVIAQEIQVVLPEVVATREDGTLAVKYDRIVALLIEAIKDLSAKVDTLEAAVK